MFTIAAVSTNVVALPVGTILDRYGPRLCGIVGSLFLILGSVFLIIAPKIPFNGYIPGYLFLALGGPFIFISSFQLSNCFPRHSGLILALLTGAFDSSSAIFLIYRLIYFSSDGDLTPQQFFTIYLVVPIFTLLAQILVMPKNSYKTVGEIIKQAEDPSSHDILPEDGDLDDRTREDIIQEQRRARRESVLSEITPLIGDKKGHAKAKRQEDRKKEISGVWGVLHGRSALQQIRTPWFILITLFVVIQMTRINYFVATIRPQYEYLLSKYRLAVHVNNVFDVALPAGGVASIPFIGMILDNLSTPVTILLLVVWATLIGVFGVLPYLWAAYANVVLFVIYRPLYYTAVSDYAAKVFGFHTFGKVYGLIICISGLCNFSQSGLDALTHRVFNGDPVPVNIILMSSVFAVGVVMVGYVYRKSQAMAREWLEEEAEDATEVAMPDVSEESIQENGYSTMNRGDNSRTATV